MTQGDPLSAKLFNILVDAVAPEWLRELREGGDYEEWELAKLMSTFFAIFYVNNAYLASRDTYFLQRTLDLLVSKTDNDLHPGQDLDPAPGWFIPAVATRPHHCDRMKRKGCRVS